MTTLRVIIELDGAVFDVRSACWEAYSRAAAAVGAARTDPNTFWRLIRTDAPRAQLVAQASPGQTRQFCTLFDEALESAECLACCQPHADVRGQLARLGLARDRVLVTCGRNRAARQALLREHDLEALFMEMAGLSADASRRASELRALSDGQPRTVVLAASMAVVRSATAAGLCVIGCAGGTSTPRRLTQAGAAWVLADLQELIDDVETGGARLRALGVPGPAMP